MTLPLALAALLLAAPPDPAVVEQVEALLGSIDTRIPAAHWKGLGPAAVPVLAGIVTSEGRMPSTRSRAVVALAAADASEGERVSRALVDAPDAPPTVRQAAVRTLGHLLAPEALRAALAPVLRSGPEPTLRAVAAETLARHAPAHGCAEVMDQVGLEAPGDRVRFERAATLCAGR
ncbi:MAG: hypothetical protein WCS72_05430 [Deltaproteobacteria bacterium]